MLIIRILFNLIDGLRASTRRRRRWRRQVMALRIRILRSSTAPELLGCLDELNRLASGPGGIMRYEEFREAGNLWRQAYRRLRRLQS